MKKLATLSFLPLFALCGRAATCQFLTLADGASAQNLTISILSEQQLGAQPKPFLKGVEFLPIEMTRRTKDLETRIDRSRRLTRQGLTRLELPTGARIFRYRRQGGAYYGFLLILRDGSPLQVLEAPGVGVSGKDDPFEDRIGVANGGGHAAITSKAGALWIVRLDGMNYASSKSPARPITLKALPMPMSLSVGASVLFFGTQDEKLWRCPLADLGVPAEITPKGALGSRLKDEIALSGNGKTICFLYGPKKLMSVYLAHEKGPAVKLPLKAAKYEEPGYLPETPGGPRLLLNDDATRLLYVDATVRDEIYLMATATPFTTTHITSDGNFQPYIGTGIIPRFVDKALAISVGDPGRFDVYGAATSSKLVQNLTMSGGNTKRPFAAGKLLPQNLASTGGASFLMTEKTSAVTWQLRSIDLSRVVSKVVATGLSGELSMSASTGPSPEYLIPFGTSTWKVSSKTGALLLATPGGITLGNNVSDSAGVSLFEARIAGSSIAILFARGLGYIPLMIAPRRLLPVTTRAGGWILLGKDLGYLSPKGGKLLKSPSPLRLLLSGAGA